MRVLQPTPSIRAERGIALQVVMLFLVVILVTGIFGVRRALLAEGLTRNQLDYEVARQAAEAALRDGERDLMLVSGAKGTGAACGRDDDRPVMERTGMPYFDADCPRGQCRFTQAYYDASDYSAGTNPQPWWATRKAGLWDDAKSAPLANCAFTGAVPLGTFTGTPAMAGVARQPEYLIEYMARGDDIFMRISARGFGADVNTEVLLQSYFRPFLR